MHLLDKLQSANACSQLRDPVLLDKLETGSDISWRDLAAHHLQVGRFREVVKQQQRNFTRFRILVKGLCAAPRSPGRLPHPLASARLAKIPD